MRTILVVLALAAVALADFLPFQDYHEEVGIPHYEAIKAYEDALDFDGSRIAGGSHARLGQYPFMVGVQIHLDNRNSVCGASLVTNTRSVTAAHCWRHNGHNARSFTLVFGSIRLNGGTQINTNQVEMHSQYNMRNMNNDIAVIRHNRINFNNNINRINLASGSNQFVGVHANAVGFGQKGDGMNIPNNQPLSHVRLQVISNAVCSRPPMSTNLIISSTICTSGAGNRGACVGDSGGPLAVGNTLIGVVSFASNRGCSRGYPVAYQRVTSFNSWIRARL